jgi:GTP cyclohydrolase I
MKQNETPRNIPHKEKEAEGHRLNGNSRDMSGIETPLRPDAFALSDEEKMLVIGQHFKGIMHALGLDLNDDSLAGTPERVARMYVKEVFSGLKPENKPKITLFRNRYKYNQMLVEKDITFYSHCEHHFVPIIGKVHLAYISSGKVIGLSKLNRIVQYYAKRPQVQERMTMQIGRELQQVLNTDSVAVLVDARHFCVSSRGVADRKAVTVTSFYEGDFADKKRQIEFLRYVEMKNEY